MRTPFIVAGLLSLAFIPNLKAECVGETCEKSSYQMASYSEEVAVEAPRACSGGYAGFNSYGGPARGLRAHRLSRIGGNCGLRSRSANRRLERMNRRYGN